MYCTIRAKRGVCLAALVLSLAVSAPLSAVAAQGSRVVAPPDRHHGRFTRGQAVDVLATARQQLRSDNRAVRARKPAGSGVHGDLTLTLRDLYLAQPALGASDRRAAQTLLSRGRVFVGGTPDPITVSTPSVLCSTNFCVHYRPVPASPQTDGEATTTAQVQATLSTLEQVRTAETRTLGYRAPVSDAPDQPSPDNPDSKFDVFLGDIASQGIYGYCAPDGAAPTSDGRAAAFCVLDNDYARSDYHANPIDALRVTAAHEFFHAIQFAYDVNEDTWFMEGTATWIEDEVFDSVNDNYQYLAESPIRYPGSPTDLSVGLHRYGAWLFFKYVSERFHSPNVIRQFWEYADAPTRRYSLQAIRAVIAAHGVSWPGFFSAFGSWNALPALSYSEGSRYPAPVFALSRTLAQQSKRARSTGWVSVRLPHLSSAAVRVLPSARLSPRKRLLIEVDAPNTARGATALVQQRQRNGVVIAWMVPLNASGNGRLTMRFNHRTLTSVAVVVSNTSSSMRDCGRVSDGSGDQVFSCYGRGYYDQNQMYSVRATLR